MRFGFLVALIIVLFVVVNVTEGSRRRNNHAAARRRAAAAAARRRRIHLARLRAARLRAARLRAARLRAARLRAARQRAARRRSGSKHGSGNCQASAKSDLVIVVDASGSVGARNFVLQRNFVHKLVSGLNVAPGAVRVGLVRYSTGVQLLQHFTSNKRQILSSISRMSYPGGWTATGSALRVVRTHFLPKRRRGVPFTTLLLTDGKSNRGPNAVNEANLLKRGGSFVNVIGISRGVNVRELNAISSQGKFYRVSNFNRLAGALNSIKVFKCSPKPRPSGGNCSGSAKSDLVIVVDASGSVGARNFVLQRNFVYKMVSGLNVAPGAVRVGLVRYSTGVQLLQHFTSNKRQILSSISRMSYPGGWTATGSALRVVRTHFLPKRRRGVPFTTLLLTDGKSNRGPNAVNEANLLKRGGSFVNVIGISRGVNVRELNAISSQGKFYRVSNFNRLAGALNSIKVFKCSPKRSVGSNAAARRRAAALRRHRALLARRRHLALLRNRRLAAHRRHLALLRRRRHIAHQRHLALLRRRRLAAHHRHLALLRRRRHLALLRRRRLAAHRRHLALLRRRRHLALLRRRRLAAHRRHLALLRRRRHLALLRRRRLAAHRRHLALLRRRRHIAHQRHLALLRRRRHLALLRRRRLAAHRRHLALLRRRRHIAHQRHLALLRRRRHLALLRRRRHLALLRRRRHLALLKRRRHLALLRRRRHLAHLRHLALLRKRAAARRRHLLLLKHRRLAAHRRHLALLRRRRHLAHLRHLALLRKRAAARRRHLLLLKHRRLVAHRRHLALLRRRRLIAHRRRLAFLKKRRLAALLKRRRLAALLKRRRLIALLKRRNSAARRKLLKALKAKNLVDATRKIILLIKNKANCHKPHPKPHPKPGPKPICQNKGKLEMVFVVDASASIGPGNYNLLKNFIANLVKRKQVGPHHIRVGVVRFSTFSTVVTPLSGNRAHVLKKVRNMYYDQGITATGDGLDQARTDVLNKARKGVRKLVFLITDGKANFGANPITAANKLKRSGAHVTVLGITNLINPAELKAISSTGRFHKIGQFKHLSGLVNKLTNC